MGHGLTALLVGENFERLEIYENGGGVAYSSVGNSYLPTHIARALIAAGGLLGPAVSGSVLIVSAKNPIHSRFVLRILIAVIVISLLLWIRSLWGLIVMGGFVVALVGITFFRSRKLEVVILLFLGLQCALSTYLQLDYLFTKQFERDGKVQISDTQSIAQHTFGTYWMWALLIIIVSAFLLWKSFRFYFKK